MKAPDSLLYEYAVIRFVPRVDREEFVNIGLIMMSKRNKWLKTSLHFDEKRLKALFPEAEVECLKRQSRLFELTDVPSADLPVEEKYRWLTAVKSACLQVSPSHPGLLSPATSSSFLPIDTILDSEAFSGSESDSEIPSLLNREFSRLFSSLVL